MSFQISKRKVARKDHVCDYCRTVIPKGVEYTLTRGNSDGQFYGSKSCYYCDEAFEVMQQDHEFSLGSDDYVTEDTLMMFASECCEPGSRVVRQAYVDCICAATGIKHFFVT